MDKTIPAAPQPKRTDVAGAQAPVVPGPFDLSPDIAKAHPTGCNPGETYADRDRRLGR